VDRRQALRRLSLATAGACLARPLRAQAVAERAPVLRRSDVVFMYQAERAVYADYGATVLAWGGTPTPESLEAARGVAFYGSVGMVTEFAGYHDRFPATWEAGLCRDVHGQPVKVPWLTDHRHRGVPYWWCCTRQPQFRQFLEERVTATVRAGARGVHVDDHLGTAGALFLGACFCDRCVEGFRPRDPDYRASVLAWLEAAPAGEKRRVQDHPLWPEWSAYHLRAAATHMGELRALAAREAGREVPMSANAGLLWPNHLADYRALDFFSAEIEHGAASLHLTDRPLFAYRIADAMGRPLAATASGQDWAFVKERGCPGLVRGWIAASYAAGHALMAPHRQWCYTEDKGTHWYDGPREAYALLYRFVRESRALLDDYEAWAEVGLMMPHRAFAADRERWIGMGEALAAAGVPYRLVIGGDDVVDRSITSRDLSGLRVLVSPAPEDLLPADRRAIEAVAPSVRRVTTVGDAIAVARTVAAVEGEAPVRVLPRVGPGGAVLHVLGRAYYPKRDAVEAVRDVTLRLDLEALGVAGCRRARVISPGSPLVEVPVERGRVRLPSVGLWTMVHFQAPA
jgi:hypothetical protein